jgi:hypothetical protein
MAKQRVDQSVFAMAGARMNSEPGRFIDNDEIIVFEENLKGHRLWSSLDLLQRRLDEFNLIAIPHKLAWPGPCAVEPNESAAD